MTGILPTSRPSTLTDDDMLRELLASNMKQRLKMKPYPTYRQREVLQHLMPGDWMPLLKSVPIGERLLATLLQTGWIERSLDVNAGDLYRITEPGRTAFRTPVPIR